MSQPKDLVELCTLLVDEIYGELTSRIFAMLLRRGRLTIGNLSAHTRLSPRQLQHGLAVLIQQNLVYFLTEKPSNTTYYEANQEAAYNLIRSGKITEIVESRYDGLARDLVQGLLLLGHARVEDLIEDYESRFPHADQNDGDQPHANGETNGDANHVSTSRIETTLFRLLRDGFLEVVTEAMFRSPTDTRSEAEKRILSSKFAGSTKGTKQKEELEHLIREEMLAIRTKGADWKLHVKKRSLNGDSNGVNGGHSKRRKLLNGGTEVNGDYADDGLSLELELVLRINYDKLIVALRSQRLVESARQQIGETTSNVYAEILRLMEGDLQRCRSDPNIDDVDDPPEGPMVKTTELAIGISPSVNVAVGIGKVLNDRSNHAARYENGNDGHAEVDLNPNGDDEIAPSTNGSRVRSEMEDEEDPFEPVRPAKRAKVTFEDRPPTKAKPHPPEDRESKLLHIRNHLMLLKSDDLGFLSHRGNNGSGEWTVGFADLMQNIRDNELDLIIMQNFGKFGHRLVRIMRKMGKVEEKPLTMMSLMRQKDIRTKLAQMQMAGMIDVQGLPKDTNNTAKLTLWLWYFDAERVSANLLNNVYKVMSRCLQRLEVERRAASGILSLTERTDVRGNIENVLTGAQNNLLNDFRDKEEKLLTQLARLDELVGVFRDY